MVFAEDNSFQYFTFWEYLSYVFASYGQTAPDVTELIRGFHFEDHTHILLKDLSTGNRKKVFLITAFALKPQLLLLDEPVNGLDFQSTEYLYQQISGYKAHGTVLFSSHILESITLTSDRVIVLENVQDPGNVGTVIRTANALGMDAVALVGNCASVFGAKTARASMGALFRQCVLELTQDELCALLEERKLPLYGAALSTRARDVREIDLSRCAVAIGSEGQGISEELLGLCEKTLKIPMESRCESLNAAMAAAIVLWEGYRNR